MKKLLSFPLSILFLLFFNFSNSQASVTAVTSFDASATLKIGDQIDVIVSFTQPVTVTGTPQLELETGTTDTKINYLSGSGSSFIFFRYTVAEGNTSSDLDYTSTSALTLNGGTINGSDGSAAILTLPSPGGSGSLAGIGDDEKNFIVDGIKPTMTISASQISNGGVYDDNLSLTFTSSESTTNFVEGDITLSNGTLSSFAGSGTTYTATFTPSSDGVATIDVSADSYTDTAGNGNPAATTFSWTFDETAPAFTSVAAADGTYKVGDDLDITVTWNETVNVTGTPTLTLSNGATATYQSGSGSSSIVFRYTVSEGQNDSNDLSVSSYSGNILDGAGNSAAAASGDLGAVIIDANTPSLSSVTAADGTYKVGDDIDITVTWSETINVTGTPTLALSNSSSATYQSGTGSSSLVFRYTVSEGQNDSNDLSVSSYSGTISDAAGNLAAAASGDLGAVIVDANTCLLYTSPSPRDGLLSRMPSSA